MIKSNIEPLYIISYDKDSVTVLLQIRNRNNKNSLDIIYYSNDSVISLLQITNTDNIKSFDIMIMILWQWQCNCIVTNYEQKQYKVLGFWVMLGMSKVKVPPENWYYAKHGIQEDGAKEWLLELKMVHIY